MLYFLNFWISLYYHIHDTTCFNNEFVKKKHFSILSLFYTKFWLFGEVHWHKIWKKNANYNNYWQKIEAYKIFIWLSRVKYFFQFRFHKCEVKNLYSTCNYNNSNTVHCVLWPSQIWSSFTSLQYLLPEQFWYHRDSIFLPPPHPHPASCRPTTS